jgi:hypothetical protein
MGGSWIVRHRYTVLLVLLLAALAFQSVVVRTGTGGVASDVVRTALGLAIFFVVFERRGERAVLAAIFVAMLAIGWSRHFLPASADGERALAFHVLMAVFFGTAVFVILRELFRRRASGAENVLGAVCGYLIAGDAWAALNEIAFQFDPATYSINPALAPLVANWQGRLALFSYYSLAQMLTIGYSDVTPVRAPATTLSLFAALFGLFYTAVVVSQLVGLAQSGSGKDRRET